MILTKECHYAMKAVIRLGNMEKTSVKELCRYENIPLAFGYKILKKLAQNGIVKSYQGSRGGYQLAKYPGSLTMLEIIQAMGDDDNGLLHNKCLKKEHSCNRHVSEKPCSLNAELVRIQGRFSDELSRCTLQNLIDNFGADSTENMGASLDVTSN